MTRTDVNERVRAVEREHEEWLRDAAAWRQEHNGVIRLMSLARTWLEEQADLLDEHEKKIRSHTHRLARDRDDHRTANMQNSPHAADQIHMAQQQQDDLDHEHVRQAHEDFRTGYATVVNDVTELLHSLRFRSSKAK